MVRKTQRDAKGNNYWVSVLKDLVSGQELSEFIGGNGRFSKDGNRLITHNGKQAFIWEVSTGRKLRTLDFKTPVLAAALNPRGTQAVASTSGNLGVYWLSAASPEKYLWKGVNELSLWNVDSGERIHTFDPSNADCQECLDFSPDGRNVLSGGGSYAVLWDPATGQSVRAYGIGSAFTLAVAFSPDGKQVLTVTNQKKAIIWDVASGKQLRVFSTPWEMTCGAFSPDGRLLLAGLNNGAARLWDIATGSELAEIVNVNAAGDWLVATPEGLFDGSELGRQLVTYRVDTGLTVVPVDRFFQDLYHPGLLGEIWNGRRPMPDVEFAKSRAPSIRIVSPAADKALDQQQVTIDVELRDRGGGMQGPWLFQNGARVITPGQSRAEGPLVKRTFTVGLVEGPNRFEIKAACADGSWESEPAVLLVNYEKPLPKPELYLVAAGVNRYAESTLNLKFAADDARNMAEVFRQRAPKLYGAERTHVTQLLDTEATKQGILQALDDVAHKARAQDTIVIFLAGHGTLVGQRYYFIPHDFIRKADKLDDDIRSQAVAGDEIDDAVARMAAVKRVMIYDTCQSGGAFSLNHAARSPFAFQKALEQMGPHQGSFIIAATAAKAEAQEVPELGHGVLTYALLAGLGATDSGPFAGKPCIRPTAAWWASAIGSPLPKTRFPHWPSYTSMKSNS